MWGIKKWPRRILKGTRIGATIINNSGIGAAFPPLGIAAAALSQPTEVVKEKEMKNFWIQIFILPNLRSLAAFLRLKDENSTGADDEAAEAIEYTVARLEAYLMSGEGTIPKTTTKE